MAQGHVSAATRLAMHRLGGTQRLNKSGERPVRAFITVDSPRTVEQLRGMGVSIQSRFGGMVTARLPLSAVSRVCRVAGVRQVSVAQVAQVCNDSALADARVLPLMQGAAFARHYDGSDVVVGIIDSGVDFNHINLCDAMGSRVAAAYLPQDSTGIAPVIDGDTLPGSCYETAEQIAQIEAARNMKQEYDEDCPEITPDNKDMYDAMMKAVGERNRRIAEQKILA